MPTRIITIVGTRPEAIKLAPVMKALQGDERFEAQICSTGQHREMLDQIMNWFHLRPDFELNVMSHNQPLAHLSGRILNGVSEILANHKPDMVVVHGDTTTAFIGALAAYYNRIPVAHVEAGLRTRDLYAPYPEEANRQLIGRLAKWHFAPTATAANALFDEMVRENVYVTGNTVIDALFDTLNMVQTQNRNPLPQIAADQRMVLVTAHRRENYGDGFRHMCAALKKLAQAFPDVAIVYPVHLNPNVRTVVMEELSGISNIHLTKPMDYPDFVAAMARSTLVLTDSGGIQEEAPALGKPVLVMRDTTERPEAVKSGTVKLVGTDTQRLFTAAAELLTSDLAYQRMSNATNPYGDGQATQRILNILAGEAALQNTFVAA